MIDVDSNRNMLTTVEQISVCYPLDKKDRRHSSDLTLALPEPQYSPSNSLKKVPKQKKALPY